MNETSERNFDTSRGNDSSNTVEVFVSDELTVGALSSDLRILENFFVEFGDAWEIFLENTESIPEVLYHSQTGPISTNVMSHTPQVCMLDPELM